MQIAFPTEAPQDDERALPAWVRGIFNREFAKAQRASASDPAEVAWAYITAVHKDRVR